MDEGAQGGGRGARGALQAGALVLGGAALAGTLPAASVLAFNDGAGVLAGLAGSVLPLALASVVGGLSVGLGLACRSLGVLLPLVASSVAGAMVLASRSCEAWRGWLLRGRSWAWAGALFLAVLLLCSLLAGLLARAARRRAEASAPYALWSAVLCAGCAASGLLARDTRAAPLVGAGLLLAGLFALGSGTRGRAALLLCAALAGGALVEARGRRYPRRYDLLRAGEGEWVPFRGLRVPGMRLWLPSTEATQGYARAALPLRAIDERGELLSEWRLLRALSGTSETFFARVVAGTVLSSECRELSEDPAARPRFEGSRFGLSCAVDSGTTGSFELDLAAERWYQLDRRLFSPRFSGPTPRQTFELPQAFRGTQREEAAR